MQRVNFRGYVLAFAVSLWIILGNSGPVFAGTATETLKKATDKIVNIVTGSKYKNNPRLRREALREVIDSLFSYKQMSMRSLAKNWKNRTAEERKEFVRLFSKLLENSYAAKLEAYSDEKINYMSEKVKGNYAIVRTEIVREGGTLTVDYKFIKQKDSWMVYDFAIEKVSMIQIYRFSFNEIIKKESYQALRKKLNSKVIDLES